MGSLNDLFQRNRQVLTTPEGKRSESQVQRVSSIDKQADRIVAEWHSPSFELATLRGQTFEAMDVLVRTAADESRGLTDAERAEYEEHRFVYETLDRALDHQPYGAGGQIPQIISTGANGPAVAKAVLTRSDSMTESMRSRFKVDPDGLSFDRYVRGIVTGDWTEPESALIRAQGITPDTAGGYIVPAELSASLIDLARNKARVLEAGALTVPMTSKELTIGRISGDPTATWHAENESESFSETTFEAVTFHSKTLVALIKGSVEVFEDANELASKLEDAMAAALAVELDRAALRGDGASSEPIGILNQDDVVIDALTGTVANYDPFSIAVQTVWSNNGTPSAVIYSPRTAGTLDRLKDTTNQPLRPPESFAALTKLVTKQIPENLGAGSDETEAYVGDFGQLMIGMRTELRLEATRVGGSNGDGSAFTDLQVWLRAYLRADVQLAQPRHFVVLTEIQP